MSGRFSPSAVLVLAAIGAGCSESARSSADGGETAGPSRVTGSEGTASSGESLSTTAPTTTASGGPGSEGPASNSTGASEGSEGDIRFDVAFETGTTTAADEGCQKVDFLFVVDNSGSMHEEQVRLRDEVPTFMRTVLDRTADDFHVMVIDADTDQTTECRVLHCGSSPRVTCDGYPCMDPDRVSDCDKAIGAGVRTPWGPSAANRDCDFSSANRFLVEADSVALEERFRCAAQVGYSSIEGPGGMRPFTAMSTALSPAMQEPGGCNEGFLRDDAILVITVLSDDTAGNDLNGDPAAWVADVVAAKAGDPSAVVVLGFIPWDDVSCITGGAPAQRYIEFVDSFGAQGVKASVCTPDYKAVFDSAIDLIDTTCQQFSPPG